MIGRLEVGEDLLHAFIDGELEEPRRAEVAEAIARDPALSERAAAYRADKAALAQLYGSIPDRPLPPEWIERIERSVKVRSPQGPARWMALAAALVVAVVSLVYFRPISPDTEDAIVREAIAARTNAIAPGKTLMAGNSAQARRIDRTMTALLGMRLKAPDLSRMGYELASARFFEGVRGTGSVELSYRAAGRPVLTVFVRRPTGAVRFDQFKRDGLRICVWQDEVLGTVISGEVSAAEMQRLASLAYTGLES
jgi:anti-sigma factor RsiW